MRNKATSNIKIQQVISSIGLDDIGMYLRDGLFSSDIGIVNIHPSIGTYWVCYINETYFDSCGCVCPKKSSKFIIKRNGCCLNSEYKIQGLTNKRESFCASYCFYILYLTKVMLIDFKSAVMNLYYKKCFLKKYSYNYNNYTINHI